MQRRRPPAAAQAPTRMPRQTLVAKKRGAHPERGAMPRDSPHCPAALHRPVAMRMTCIENPPTHTTFTRQALLSQHILPHLYSTPHGPLYPPHTTSFHTAPSAQPHLHGPRRSTPPQYFASLFQSVMPNFHVVSVA
eukprot:jgi/Psemu1/33268/gm1.33268_g